ncbi:MAG: hypothetical protein ABIS86_18020, partial [Streptosporangiaceae bacterium]
MDAMAGFSSASTGQLVEVLETVVLELAGREAPGSGAVCLELAERVGRALDIGEAGLAGLVGRVEVSGV